MWNVTNIKVYMVTQPRGPKSTSSPQQTYNSPECWSAVNYLDETYYMKSGPALGFLCVWLELLLFLSIGWDVSELQPTWYMSMENHGGMILTGDNRRIGERSLFQCHFSATNPIRTDAGANRVKGRRLTTWATVRQWPAVVLKLF
jgi:hypothetical protein